MDNKIKVIIADDEYYTRKGLETVLLKITRIEKIAHAENGKQVLALLEKEFYHIVFMDLRMPGMDGFQTVSHIQQCFRKVKVIVFTIHGTDEMLFEMYDRGAMGYIFKTDGEADVSKAIDTVLSGEYYYADGSGRFLNHTETEKLRKQWGIANCKLSEPEREVLVGICEEHSLKDIGNRMQISFPKIQYHHKRLLFKTESADIAGLVRYAIRNCIYKEKPFAGLRRFFGKA